MLIINSFREFVKSFKINYLTGLNDRPSGPNSSTEYIEFNFLSPSLIAIVDLLDRLEDEISIYRSDDWYEHEGPSFGRWGISINPFPLMSIKAHSRSGIARFSRAVFY